MLSSKMVANAVPVLGHGGRIITGPGPGIQTCINAFTDAARPAVKTMRDLAE